MSKRKSAYYRYLDSQHWRKLRLAAFKRDGFKCVLCGSTEHLRGHHIHYGKDLLKVPVEWIQTLCNACHEDLHKRKKKERKLKRAERLKHRRFVYLIAEYSALY